MFNCLWKTLLGKSLRNEFSGTRQAGARRALIILSTINLLNFADRYVPSAVKSLIQDDLGLSDFETSLPSTGMVVMYMIFAVIFGTLSDKEIIDRRIIIFGAIIFWSIATTMAGLAKNIVQLVAIRSLVGVGEAAYGTIAPPMLSDFYPSKERNIVYAIYYLAIPLGGALGFAIGAVIGAALGWREAFYIVGAPGLVAAFYVLKINNPYQGVHDSSIVDDKIGNRNKSGSVEGTNEVFKSITVDDENQLINPINSSSSSSNHKSFSGTKKQSSPESQWWIDLKVAGNDLTEILCNKHFIFALLGQAANNFALGGLADWYATFLLRYAPGATLSSAGLIAGAATIIGGIGGNILGAKTSDYYLNKNFRSAYFLVPALFTIPASLFLLLAINVTSSYALMSVFIVIGEIFVWTYLAPISAISISVIPPRLRARSCGVLIFAQHIIGDIISPPIIGAISDSTGSLKTALQCTWMAVIISGIWWLIGYFCLSDVHDLIKSLESEDKKQVISSSSHSRTSLTSAANKSDEASEADVTYKDLLLGTDLLVLDVNGHQKKNT